SGVPTSAVSDGSRRPVVIVFYVKVVTRIDHFIETADVIAMLMTGDRVVETDSRCDPDRLEIRHHLNRAFSGISGFHQYRSPIGTFYEYRGSPTNVDVMNFELLCCSRNRKDYKNNPKEHTRNNQTSSHFSASFLRKLRLNWEY